MTHEEALLIDIKFQLDMYASGKDSAEDTLARVREIVSSLSLTDDQQVVLDYLKNIYSDVYEDCSPLETMYLFGGRRAWSEESNLTDKEEFQVLAAFASWGLNSCQNGNS